ncbi:MAG: hypothetical protein QOK30_1068 [Nocardioidaceae bacterium]|nr:hypothetical protein [Nocardioidaceae bacterium]
MDPGSEAVVLRELREQACKDGSILPTEGPQEVATVRLGHSTDVLEALVAGGSELQSVVAAVCGVAASLEEAVSFQVIDQGDQGGRQHPELGGQCLLGAAGRRRHRPEQTGLRWGETEGRQPLGEPHGCQPADLSEHERHLSHARLTGPCVLHGA